MCGIAGILKLNHDGELDSTRLRRMIGMLAHRGPDSTGCYIDHRAQLGNARLSIIDLAGGQQPVHNEDKSLWAVCNGEIHNFIELRQELISRGHHFHTASDIEVIVHLYEEKGPACLDALNGQFAVAIWDRNRKSLFLARDRLGICPLYYARVGDELLFASEIKALFVERALSREFDPIGIDQFFTFWATLPGRTLFRSVAQVPAGHYISVTDGNVDVRRYWQIRFRANNEPDALDEAVYAEQLHDLLIDSTQIRLRADVQVGAYLSGGLDSSITTAIVKNCTNTELRTFSIAFTDRHYDETTFQQQVVQQLGVKHTQFECSGADVARVFPEVVWHAETPMLRTAPAPLFILSDLVHRSGLKVVLTGEGADEFLAGYDIFKEAQIRRFWARQPESKLRPQLFRRIYGFVPQWQQGSQPYLEAFFRPGLQDYANPLYSHLIRWQNTAKLKRFFSSELRAELQGYDSIGELASMLDPEMSGWHPLAQAQYLEIFTFLSEYLLCSQGDRMIMGHSVEGRYPYLDHRVVEFCNQLPAHVKLRGLNEKFILKKALGSMIPEAIVKRVKQPYRAPIRSAFCGKSTPDYVKELLSADALMAAGIFSDASVTKLTQKCLAREVGEWDNMALVGALSLQILDRQFHREFDSRSRGVCAMPDRLVVVDDDNSIGENLTEGAHRY